MVARGREIDGLTLAQVDVQAATGRAVAAGHPGRRVGHGPRRNLTQPDTARPTEQFAGQRAVFRPDQRADAVEQGGRRGGWRHETIPPGILGRTTAAKIRQRSASSPAIATRKARVAIAAPSAGIDAGPRAIQYIGSAIPPTTQRATRSRHAGASGPSRSNAERRRDMSSRSSRRARKVVSPRSFSAATAIIPIAAASQRPRAVIPLPHEHANRSEDEPRRHVVVPNLGKARRAPQKGRAALRGKP